MMYPKIIYHVNIIDIFNVRQLLKNGKPHLCCHERLLCTGQKLVWHFFGCSKKCQKKQKTG